MARIQWVDEPDAGGEVAEAYAEWFAANPGRVRIPNILKCFSLRPDVFRDVETISNHLHFSDGHLPWRVKEMIATYVSALNQCPYCRGAHAFFLQRVDPTAESIRMALVRGDLDAAPITDAERGLLRFAALVTQAAYKTSDADAQTLRQLGWTDPQIAECVYVTALFALFNRVANAFGLEDDYLLNPPPIQGPRDDGAESHPGGDGP